MFISISMSAQAPSGFSYQAIVRNANGQLVSNQIVSVQIRILQGSASGLVVYAENHSVNTNVSGLMTLIVGNGTVIQGSLSQIKWGEDVYFIQSNIDPSGG